MSAAGRAVCGGREAQWFVAGPAVLDGEDLQSAAFSSVATGCRPASAGGIRNVVSLVSAVVVNPFSSGGHCGLKGSAHRERGLVARIWESIKDEPVLSGSHGEEAVVVRCRGNLSDPMPSILEARSRSRGGARQGRDGMPRFPLLAPVRCSPNNRARHVSTESGRDMAKTPRDRDVSAGTTETAGTSSGGVGGPLSDRARARDLGIAPGDLPTGEHNG